MVLAMLRGGGVVGRGHDAVAVAAHARRKDQGEDRQGGQTLRALMSTTSRPQMHIYDKNIFVGIWYGWLIWVGERGGGGDLASRVKDIFPSP